MQGTSWDLQNSRLDSTFRQNVEKPPRTHCLCLSQSTLRSVAEALDLVAPQRLRDVFHHIRHCAMIPKYIYPIHIHPSSSFAKMLLLEAIHQSQTCHCCTVANAPAWTCSSVWWWGNADLSHLSHLRFCMLRLMLDVVSCCLHFAHSTSLVTSRGCSPGLPTFCQGQCPCLRVWLLQQKFMSPFRPWSQWICK